MVIRVDPWLKSIMAVVVPLYQECGSKDPADKQIKLLDLF